ncbi:uncharacterized protein VTP21DRAFT_9060 [Calcarisporiella thermophila]|uniref:uncharacterized protein n=1 Tax=Calcarisporiella thermophila TaxID=911321 RepID=UPI00374411FA
MAASPSHSAEVDQPTLDSVGSTESCEVKSVSQDEVILPRDAVSDASLPSTELVDQHADVKQSDTMHSTDDGNALSGRDLFLVLGSLSISFFLGALDNTIVSTALTRIAYDFHEFESVSWVATVYLLAGSSLQPIYGKLADIFGGKNTYLFSMAIFLVGSVISGAAQSMSMLIGARLIQGIGAAGMMDLPMVLLVKLVGVQQSSKYMGVFGMMFALASAIGPLLGGVFTDKVSWRWSFYINVPLVVPGIILTMIFLVLPEVRTSFMAKLRRIDWLGSLTFVSAVVCFLLATLWGGHVHAWNSAVIIALYVVSVVLCGIFFFIEAKVAVEPIMPLGLYRSLNYTLSSLIAFVFGIFFFGLIFVIPIFFQAVRGESAIQAGLQLLPFLIPLALTVTLSGMVVSKTGSYRPFILLGSIISTLGSGLLILLDQHSSPGMSAGFLVICGIGAGFSFQTSIIAAQATLVPQDMSSGTTLIAFFRTIGGVIGVAIFSAIQLNIIQESLSGLPNGAVLIETANKGIEFISTLSPEDQKIIGVAYGEAFHKVFIAMTPLTGIMILLTLGLKHIELTPQASAASTPTPLNAEEGMKNEKESDMSPV